MFSVHQDMRSPRFAYKTEESHPDVVEVLAKHAFPLSHNLVSHFLMFVNVGEIWPVFVQYIVLQGLHTFCWYDQNDYKI